MKLVLLSGGSGKRLWPLSNDSRSKQFIKVLRNEENELESMVQRVWRQLSSIGLADSTFIATGKAQVEMLHSQIGTHVPIIIEPKRRDTFPAIALAASYMYSVAGIDPDEVVAILPVDPYVEDRFFNRILDLEQVVRDSSAEIALIGVEPTYPSEKYGYIVPDSQHEEETNYVRVKRFAEKPTEELAVQLIQEHALWNCGVFAFKLGYLLSILEKSGMPLDYKVLSEQYDKLPKISFDYEVVEKANSIVAISYQGGWKDLGTWNTLTEEMNTVIHGRGLLSEDSTDSHIVNELDVPVAVIGLPNVVVATSPDGILVADKSASPRVKELVDRMAEQRLMYKERRWGWYKILDMTTDEEDGTEAVTRRLCIMEGANLSYHMHTHKTEIWTVLSGAGEVIINESLRKVSAGDVIEILPGTRHSIKANSDLHIIEVQLGKGIVEEDIKRIYMSWGEIERELSIKL